MAGLWLLDDQRMIFMAVTMVKMLMLFFKKEISLVRWQKFRLIETLATRNILK